MEPITFGGYSECGLIVLSKSLRCSGPFHSSFRNGMAAPFAYKKEDVGRE